MVFLWTKIFVVCFCVHLRGKFHKTKLIYERLLKTLICYVLFYVIKYKYTRSLSRNFFKYMTICIYLYDLKPYESIYAIFTLMYMRVFVCVCVSKHDSVYTMHSIKFKFGMFVIGHCRTNPIDFSEYPTNIFLREYRKEFLCITTYEVKFFKVF